MKETIERERKFRVYNFDLSMIPPDAIKEEIVQTYLVEPHGFERRVRQSTTKEVVKYSYTEKEKTDEMGARKQRESQSISSEEYQEYLKEQDPNTHPVFKTRHSFVVGHHTHEVDIYDPNDVMLEIELDEMDEPVKFLPGWVEKLAEVTGQEMYNTRTRAQN